MLKQNKNMKKFFFLLVAIALAACHQKQQVDVLVYNAKVYTVDTTFNMAEAFAVKEGRFVAIGTSKEIKEKYTSAKTIDAKGKTITPGFIDAHCHFLWIRCKPTKSKFGRH